MVLPGERAEQLATGIIGPVVLGGPFRLQRPFGPRLALGIGDQREILDNDLKVRVDTARLRVARTVVATDAIRPPAPVEWALAAALNDLVQVTNHELSSFASRGRHLDLLDAVLEVTRSVPASRNLEEAVGRHATFARALEVRRTDTSVAWWTGSQSFRGQRPPDRLMAWPGLRNVRVNKQEVPLAEMAAGVSVEPTAYLDALAAWMACSPLSDLASCHRRSPAFRWSRHSASLVATVEGSNLALRAISWATNDRPDAADAAVAALRNATEQLPPGTPRNIALQFTKGLEEAKGHWAEVG